MGLHALLVLPFQIHQSLDDLHQLLVLLLFVLHEPGAFLCRGRVAGDSQSMMKVTFREVHLVATVGLHRLVLQLLVFHELCFVDEDMVKR